MRNNNLQNRHIESKKKLSTIIANKLEKSENAKVLGNHEKALKIARSILIQDPSCIEAAEEVVDNLLSLQDFPEAEKVANFVLSNNENSYIANYALGFIYLTDNLNDLAIGYLQKANKLSPNNPEILRCLGWAIFHVDNKLKGLITLERALNLRSDDPLILCDLGVCLLQEQIFHKAINLFEQALEIENTNERAQDCLQAALSLQKKLEAK